MTPINPITLRGKHKNEPSSLMMCYSIGRLWFKENKIIDENHQIQWDKSIVFAFWSQDASDAKTACYAEDDFISMGQRLYSQETIAVTIWGRGLGVLFDEKDSNNCGLLFDRTVDLLVITMYDSNKIVIGSTTLNFTAFINDLKHLFPKGELSLNFGI